MERIITQRDEEILRCCHHDFNGLTPTQAAEKLGVTVSTIYHALRKMRKKIPTLFPILTPRQKHMLDLLDSGFTHDEVADLTGTTSGNVGAFVTKLHGKGYHLRRQTFTVPYQDYMDSMVKEVF